MLMWLKSADMNKQNVIGGILREICVLLVLSISASCLADHVQQPIHRIQPVAGLDSRMVELGQRLFNDLRFSRDNTVSCAHCHHLATGGADNLAVSRGVGGKKGNINAPTVYNLADQVAYYWNGRASTLEQQISVALENPIEMDSSWTEVLAKLEQDDALVRAFQRVFPEGMNKTSVARALASFMLSLSAVDSPFDLWLAGDENALSAQQIRGYRLFKEYGCITCHQGKNVGGNLFATMGIMGDYFQDRGDSVTTADLGRYNVTGKEQDRHVFKVPSLRMVSLTQPYFHDGSASTLEDAVKTMAYYQLGRNIKERDIKDIIAFLYSLRGRHYLLTEPR